MASKAVINARSALSWSTKRTVLTQEVLRVLLNCSKLLPWERVVENVNEMVLRTQYSGYTEKFRYEVVDSALKGYRARNKKESRSRGRNNVYVGETSRSAYVRGKEHMKSLGKKKERSVLWKHCKKKTQQ